MQVSNREFVHEAYTDTPRHWCPRSERYTGADSLVTALRTGWTILGIVYREDIFLRGSRHTTVFHVELGRSDEVVIMSVVANPFLARLLQQTRVRVIPFKYQQMPRNQRPRETRAVEEEDVSLLA